MRRAERCTARGTRSCGRRAVRGGEARFAVTTRFARDAAYRVADEQPGHGPADPAPASRTLGHRGSRSATAHDPNDRSSSAQREVPRSEEHTSELQSHSDLVCRLLLEKKKKKQHKHQNT